MKTGTQLKCNNGKTYTVIICKGNKALLVGGWDYVVINELDMLEKTGAWGNGKYFPFFEDGNTDALKDAVNYFCGE